jgi:hypothetical protein
MSENTDTDLEQRIGDAQKGPARPTGDGEEICEECGRKITVDPGNGLEYGHKRGPVHHVNRERCSRRPEEVDPGNLKLKDDEARS